MWFGGIGVTPVLKDTVEVWQVPHSPVAGWFGSCAFVGRVTIVTPKKLFPAPWQFAQPELIPAWFIAVPRKLVNFVGEWQTSQGCAVGMCVGGGDTGVTLANERPLAWQVAQPLLIPWWFIVATA